MSGRRVGEVSERSRRVWPLGCETERERLTSLCMSEPFPQFDEGVPFSLVFSCLCLVLISFWCSPALFFCVAARRFRGNAHALVPVQGKVVSQENGVRKRLVRNFRRGRGGRSKTKATMFFGLHPTMPRWGPGVLSVIAYEIVQNRQAIHVRPSSLDFVNSF